MAAPVTDIRTGTMAGAGGTISLASVDGGSATDRAMVVSVQVNATGGRDISSASYNSVALTAQGASVVSDGCRQRMFVLPASATGLNTLDVVTTAGFAGDHYTVTVQVFDSIDQTTPVRAGSYITGSGGTDVTVPYETSLTVTSQVGDTVAVAHCIRGASGSGTATPTGFTETEDGNSGIYCQASGYEVGAASVATVATWGASTTGLRSWTAMGLSLAPSTPSTGFVLDPESGTTNGSGVLTTTATSDDALTANGEVRLITATVNGVVVGRLTHRPS